mmetsp:Transcript_43407/g.108990  ORF Transcript_43407/g.108990 Transcript_43407/m.108990 type:complete len:539 (+) Transcript_43407:3-1619(+)
MAKLGRKELPCSEGGTTLELNASGYADAPWPPMEDVDAPDATSVGPPEEQEPLPEKPRALKAERRSGSQGGPPVDAILDLGPCEVLRVHLPSGKVASVLKVLSFPDSSRIVRCAEVAVGLAANESDGKLIVDVIGNGGGRVSSGYLLNAYLYGKMPGTTYRKPYDACEWYDLPKSRDLDWFVRLSMQAFSNIHAASSRRRQHILALASRMETAAAALAQDPSFFGRFARVKAFEGAAVCLRRLANALDAPTLRGGEPSSGLEERASAQYRTCITQAKAEPFRASSWPAYRGADVLGYRWSNKHPKALSAPNWEYYSSTVTKIRGGESRNFSSWTFLPGSCAAYMAHFPEVYGNVTPRRAAPQTQLKHVTYVSDGLCGSTCSVASTRPYLDGLATFVTFGGVPGQPLDITTLNGGNVAAYQMMSSSRGLWTDAVSAMVDAAVFFPNETLPSWPFLPIPLNIHTVSFAQRAQYPRVLGTRALPREWYLVPGSYHLNIWTSIELTSYTVPPRQRQLARQKLYEIYSRTAALPPKPFPRLEV